jgi:uncharacterized membrane protein YdjX (TVP38/TMEM64 family)
MKSNAIKTNIKAAAFMLFFISAFFLLRYSPLGEYLNPQAMQDLVGHTGPTSPLIFILVYAIGITLFLPASLFTAVGAMLFGVSWGLLYNMTGGMLGACMSFWIARYLGRDFAASVVGDRLRNYDEKLKAKGFATTLYLRLIFFPFTPLNFGLGLTGVTFNQYFWGTLFGKIASAFILTFFFATLTEVWRGGEWGGLLGWKALFSLFLFISSFFIPKVAKQLIPDVRK